MPTSDQIKTLLLIKRYCKNSIFSKVPKPILQQLIGQYHKSSDEELKAIAQLSFDNADDKNNNEIERQKSIFDNNPDLEISILLHYVAFGNPTKVGELLKNSELLFKTGDVMLPSGDIVKCVAPYELLLGCGDSYEDMHTIDLQINILGKRLGIDIRPSKAQEAGGRRAIGCYQYLIFFPKYLSETVYF